jgi:L-ascorbate metabolism protein UlaG (beta-lactamase superfamily)
LALLKAGIQVGNIHEMDWWQSFSPAGKHGNFSSDPSSYKAGLITESDLRIVCTPAQHGSARSPFDRNGSLWSSWVVQYSNSQGGAHSFFFGGSVSINRASRRFAADG